MPPTEAVSDETLGALLRSAGLADASGRDSLPEADGADLERVRLTDGSSALVTQAGPGEVAALTALGDHPINARRMLAVEGGALLLEDAPFEPLGASLDPEAYAEFGEALGAFHREFKGRELELELHDAAWFSRAAPFVLAEVATLAEAGEYELSLSELGRLEEAGVQMAELAEPLSGLRSTLVHGACGPGRAGFVDGRPALAGWGLACAGLGWLDLARLAGVAEGGGSPCLVALVSSYADAAHWEPTVIGDLLPFCRALHDLHVLDRWNRDLGSGARPAGSLRARGELRVRRLLALVEV